MSYRRFLLGALLFAEMDSAAETSLPFPGARAAVAAFPVGRGRGEIVRVTRLAPSRWIDCRGHQKGCSAHQGFPIRRPHQLLREHVEGRQAS